jgi:hypothetical protein
VVKRLRLAFVAAALLPGVVVACSDVLGFHDLTLIDAGADASYDAPPAKDGGDASDGRAQDAMPEAAPGCAHAVPPGPPSTDDTPDGGGTEVDILLAMSTLDLGQNAMGNYDPNHPIGFDLDGVCTCFEDAGPSCVGPRLICDTAGGRDESANVVLGVLAGDPNLSQAGLQSSLSEGAFGLLLHIHGYNGLANDQSVIVEYFASAGTQKDAGTGVWTVTPETVLEPAADGGYVSSYIDSQAYVNNFVLVSQLSEVFPLVLVPNLGTIHNPITLNLSGLVLAAPLVQAGGTWSIDGGQMGARWPTSMALYDLHTIQDPVNPSLSLCGTDTTYTALVTDICGNADIAASQNAADAAAPCSALSVGLGFNAAPAQMGGSYEPTAVGVDCPDGWAPSCN